MLRIEAPSLTTARTPQPASSATNTKPANMASVTCHPAAVLDKKASPTQAATAKPVTIRNEVMGDMLFSRLWIFIFPRRLTLHITGAAPVTPDM